MSAAAHGPVSQLESLGITVAWAREMPWPVLWLPDEGVAVLNASTPRQHMAEALTRLLRDDPGEPVRTEGLA
jgi:hypothetical protein